MKILYITDGFTRLPVFRSQVHTVCTRHAQNNDVHMAIFARWPEYSDSVDDGVLYSWSKSILFPKAYVPSLNWLSTLLSGLRKIIRSADVVHCRGHVGTAMGLKLRAWFNPDIPLIADIRGAIVQELDNSPSRVSQLLSGQALRLEQDVFSGPDWFFFVSKSMQDHYSALYDLSTDKSSVFPTIVDDTVFYKDFDVRNEVRSQLGWQDTFVYAYVGGVDHWQNLDRILARFQEISFGRNDLGLLLLVTDPHSIQKKVRDMGMTEKTVQVMKVPYECVGRYLNAADAGLLIRDDTLVNRVASPTKLNEYTACGLSVVTDLNVLGDTTASGFESNGYRKIDEIVLEQEKIYRQLVASGRR